MGKIGWWLLIVLPLCWLTGCSPIKKTRDAFEQTPYCYDGSSTRLGEKIDLKGWYAFTESSGSVSHDVNCIFFEDGMFIYHFNPAYFKESADQRSGFYSKGTHWGRYVLAGDTIKAQFIESPGGMSWSKGEIWFQIVNRTSLKWLAFKYGDPIDVANIRPYQNRDMSIGSFTSAPAMPNADKAWIKSRSWFWCDIEKFKVWKQQRK